MLQDRLSTKASKSVGLNGTSRPRVLAVLPAFIPSTTLMVVKPLTNLHRSGAITADITLEPWVSPRQMRFADVIVFSRNANEAVLDLALASGKPIIYNIDDNLLEIPASYQNHLRPNQARQLKRFLTSADLVRAYSNPLRDYLLQFNTNVEAVECAVDWRLVPNSPPKRDSKTVSIVYATSRWEKDFMASLFIDDLKQLLEIHGERVRVYFWGYHPPELRDHPSVRLLSFTPNYDRFFRRFASAAFDIGLAPLSDDAFHAAKCHNKFREYGASRIAGLYSNVNVYSSCVEHERTGLLVDNQPGEWLAAMTRLIEDDALRGRIQSETFHAVREKYTAAVDDLVWRSHIKNLVGHTATGALKRRRMNQLDTVASRSTKALGFFGLLRRIAGRALLLTKLIAREGIGPAFQLGRLYGSTVSQLVRIRIALLQKPAAEMKAE